MKTRFTPLVTFKKNALDQCEKELQHANSRLEEIREALEAAYAELERSRTPDSGEMGEFLQSRMIIDLQRIVVARERERLQAAIRDAEQARQAFREAMKEYEKYKYLETEEVKAILLKQKHREERELDEIAVQLFGMRRGG